jgi:hypothetical protein
MGGYQLTIFKQDKRTRRGERTIGSYEYRDWTLPEVERELSSLQTLFYRPQHGFRIELKPLTIKVVSLMTGQTVEIDSDLSGTVCDPSRESYWSF